ncbi:hypothetical protein G6F57_014860 [Rhizopus arrhizus]|nr:hypothetical protein G6F57_014860 [Rhizopus arrhizus]
MSQSTRPSRFIPQVRSASAAATPVASTSSPAAADTEELQRLRNEVELLRQQTIDAQRRFQQQLDQLAEQQAAPAPIRRKRAKLPGLSYHLREAYQLISSSKGISWDTTTSLYGSDVNIDIHNELLVAGKRYRSDSGQITSASQAQEEIKRIKECIRSQFESFQAKRRKLELSIEKQKEKERKARYGRRMAYKLKKRMVTINALTEAQTMELTRVCGPIEECKLFINKSCISDEEDDADDSISIKVCVPSWRSEKLNTLFKNLDEYYDAKKKPGMCKLRTREVVARVLDYQTMISLPAWGIVDNSSFE